MTRSTALAFAANGIITITERQENAVVAIGCAAQGRPWIFDQDRHFRKLFNQVDDAAQQLHLLADHLHPIQTETEEVCVA